MHRRPIHSEPLLSFVPFVSFVVDRSLLSSLPPHAR